VSTALAPVTGPIASSEAPPPRARRAAPIRTRASLWTRFRTMAGVGWAMMFHDRLKLLGTLLGVVFAVVLSNQQAGTLLGLIYKNVMLPRNAGADVWIMAPGTETLAAGRFVSTPALMQARTTPGVAWAEPLLYGTVTIKKPAGGNEPMTLIGSRYPRYAGGPWNMVAGDKSVLSRPDTVIVEDSERETFGGLNVGSVREVSGRNLTVGGLTWGLIPFGPAYAFVDYELARELTKTPSDQFNFVLVGVEPGQDPEAVAKAIQGRVPEVQVMTAKKFEKTIVDTLLFRSALGVTFGTSTMFGLIVGFVIVSLSMFSAVLDNVREFGTLKAVGATNGDLAMLLVVQAVTYALLGTTLGLALVAQMAKGIRSAKLALVLPTSLTVGTVGIMVVMCVAASTLALLRIRKVEPAMVFR
jgi:putative ABC transport system permease protein